MGYSMRHYRVKVRQTHFWDGGTATESELKTIIRSKGELTEAKLRQWERRNSNERTKFKVLEVIDWAPDDLQARNI